MSGEELKNWIKYVQNRYRVQLVTYKFLHFAVNPGQMYVDKYGNPYPAGVTEWIACLLIEWAVRDRISLLPKQVHTPIGDEGRAFSSQGKSQGILNILGKVKEIYAKYWKS